MCTSFKNVCHSINEAGLRLSVQILAQADSDEDAVHSRKYRRGASWDCSAKAHSLTSLLQLVLARRCFLTVSSIVYR